jgi:hypothetical protein
MFYSGGSPGDRMILFKMVHSFGWEVVAGYQTGNVTRALVPF